MIGAKSLNGRLAERDQPALLLIPERQPHAADALHKGQSARGFELRVVRERARKPVTGNPAAQMMHVVHADIGREPAQYPGEDIVRAAMERGFAQVPTRIALPTRPVK